MKTWEDCASFHGHTCPGLAIGYRAAIEAAKILNLSFSKDEEVICVTENDACGIDAIQVILGTSAGKGNLVFRVRGKQAYSFYNRTTNKSVRLILKPFEVEMSREERQEYIKSAPLEKVFELKETTFVLPEKARIFTSYACETCGEVTAEPYIRLQEGKKICPDCYSSYTRDY